MIKGKKVVVVLPAYNAEKTLERTYAEIPFDIVDEVVLTDDKSSDNTVKLAKDLGVNHIIVHSPTRVTGAIKKVVTTKR